MKKGTTITIIVILAVIAALGMMYNVRVTDNGALPDVDVSVKDKGGLPTYSVEKTSKGRLPDIDVKVKESGRLPSVEVTAPDIDITTEKKVIEVPTGVDVDAAEGSVADQ